MSIKGLKKDSLKKKITLLLEIFDRLLLLKN